MNLKKTVLVIDDNEELSKQLVQELTIRNFNVDCSVSASGGLKIINESIPSLLFLDYDLGPGMTGIDIIEKLEKRNIKIPIIMISATESALGDAKDRFPEYVIDEILKPHRQHDLDRVLRCYENWTLDNEYRWLTTPVALIKETLDSENTYYKKLDSLQIFFEGFISYLAGLSCAFVRHNDKEFVPDTISKNKSKNLPAGDYAAIFTECLNRLSKKTDSEIKIDEYLCNTFLTSKGKHTESYTFLFEKFIKKRNGLVHFRKPSEADKCKEVFDKIYNEFDEHVYKPLYELLITPVWMLEDLDIKNGRVVCFGREFCGTNTNQIRTKKEMPALKDGIILPDEPKNKLFIYDPFSEIFILLDPFFKAYGSKVNSLMYMPHVFKNTEFIQNSDVKFYNDYSFINPDYLKD